MPGRVRRSSCSSARGEGRLTASCDGVGSLGCMATSVAPSPLPEQTTFREINRGQSTLDKYAQIAHNLRRMADRKPLKPLKIHELIGGATAWTDDQWNAAIIYLLERVGTMEAIFMAEQLHHDGASVPNYPHKVDFLREFRQYPPTVCLAHLI